ncbi:hypothetical protein SAG0136_07945 [Streptococcus agalactiae LMG 14747]|uniref:DUF669 domain-containing protein n=1 Tax=Streptococcus agalactiae LMG 14747 TaxID=1154860 RepID=V6Z2L7_STRAG|nr:hypothetical protein SAG0136_07945 [Streptococcus agalactiae LMG 14747]
MAFTTDYSNITEYADWKVQDYEIIVKDVYETTAGTGTKGLVIESVVRNDVKQEKQNAHIWDRHWHRRDTQKFDFASLMRIASALGIPEGKNFNSFEDFMNEFIGKTAKVRIRLREYNGEKQPDVHYYNKTDFPQINHTWKEAVNTTSAPTQEPDLPF